MNNTKHSNCLLEALKAKLHSRGKGSGRENPRRHDRITPQFSGTRSQPDST